MNIHGTSQAYMPGPGLRRTRQRISAAWWLSAVCLLAIAPDLRADNFRYTTNGSTVAIVGYTGVGGNVTIPGTNSDGLVITGIGGYAFYGCASLTGVAIPDGVTNIGDRAFYSCTGLTGVMIPNNVTDIGYGAFEHCSSLTSPVIGAGVTNIGSRAFASCSNISSVVIGDSVTEIGYGAFFGCASLTGILVAASNPAYCSTNGILFNKSQTVLIQYPGAMAGTYSIPNSVTNIGDDAFRDCTSLTSVIIPDCVTNIGIGAFFGCFGLTNVVIGTNVIYINAGAFCNCTGLRTVTIPNSVIIIRESAFESCSALTNVVISDNITCIDYAVFADCSNLTTVTIPDSVTAIRGDAFSGCANLTSLVISSNVTWIEGGAWSDCTSLTGVVVDAANPVYSSTDGVLFNKSHTVLIQYPGGAPETYSIPDGVALIEEAAFASCPRLTSVIVPDSVAGVQGYAFHNCTNLGAIYFLGNSPVLDISVFTHDDKATIFYLPGATGWGATYGGRPAVCWNPRAVNFDAQTNGFGFAIEGSTNITVVVRACTNLLDQSWSSLTTTTLTNGTADFRDSDSTNCAARFYRFSIP